MKLLDSACVVLVPVGVDRWGLAWRHLFMYHFQVVIFSRVIQLYTCKQTGRQSLRYSCICTRTCKHCQQTHACLHTHAHLCPLRMLCMHAHKYAHTYTNWYAPHTPSHTLTHPHTPSHTLYVPNSSQTPLSWIDLLSVLCQVCQCATTPYWSHTFRVHCCLHQWTLQSMH